ncbi:hypothetical protein WDU94_014964 [Cyamophila willieti]
MSRKWQRKCLLEHKLAEANDKLEAIADCYEHKRQTRTIMSKLEERSISRKCKCRKKSFCRKKPHWSQDMFRQFEEEVQCETYSNSIRKNK